MYKTPLTRQEYHLMSVSSLESWGRFGLRWGDALRGGEGVRYFDTIVILPVGGATTGTEALWASGSVVGGTLERITLGWQEEGIVTVWWDTGAGAGRGGALWHQESHHKIFHWEFWFLFLQNIDKLIIQGNFIECWWWKYAATISEKRFKAVKWRQ